MKQSDWGTGTRAGRRAGRRSSHSRTAHLAAALRSETILQMARAAGGCEGRRGGGEQLRARRRRAAMSLLRRWCGKVCVRVRGSFGWLPWWAKMCPLRRKCWQAAGRLAAQTEYTSVPSPGGRRGGGGAGAGRAVRTLPQTTPCLVEIGQHSAGWSPSANAAAMQSTVPTQVRYRIARQTRCKASQPASQPGHAPLVMMSLKEPPSAGSQTDLPPSAKPTQLQSLHTQRLTLGDDVLEGAAAGDHGQHVLRHRGGEGAGLEQ